MPGTTRTPRSAPPVIEVFADIWCPFAHVGLNVVADQRARAHREDVVIWVRAWPLELVNGRGLDPAVTAEHADDLRRQAAPELFRGIDPARFPTSTLEALALAHRAYRCDPATGERVSFALRDTLFERGGDVSDPAVLSGLADDLGLGVPDAADRESVIQDWQEGERRGVVGSPHFFCGAADMFCPSLDIGRTPAGELEVARDVSRLTGFLTACLATTEDGV